MSSLRYQRSQSHAQQRKQAGPEVSTMSFREKLQRKLRRLDLPTSTNNRLAALILSDPVAAMKEIRGWEKNRKSWEGRA